jgi:hypothetical protein
MTTHKCGERTHSICGEGLKSLKRKEPVRITAPSVCKSSNKAVWLYLRRTASPVMVLVLDRVLTGAGLVAASAAVGSTV